MCLGILDRKDKLSNDMLNNKVIISEIKPDQKSSIFGAVESAINFLGGIDVSQGDKIIIKPSLPTCRPPNSGTTTDFRVIEAILKLIYKNGNNFQIYIVESDNIFRRANESFERYAKLRKKYGVRLVNLSNEEISIVPLPKGRIFKKLEVPKTLQQYDYFISVANLKIHAMEGISCVMKNQFGCVPDINKSRFHPYMSEVLYDLNKFYNPNLCISGGLYGKEFDRDLYLKTGYITGKPKQVNLIICGKDALATDIVCSKVMGFNPDRIPYLKYAMRTEPMITTPILQFIGDRELQTLDFQFIPKFYYQKFRTQYKLLRLFNVLSQRKKYLFSSHAHMFRVA